MTTDQQLSHNHETVDTNLSSCAIVTVYSSDEDVITSEAPGNRVPCPDSLVPLIHN